MHDNQISPTDHDTAAQDDCAAEGAGTLMLPVIEQNGTRYLPVFTSEDALRAAGADPATAVRPPIAPLAARSPKINRLRHTAHRRKSAPS
jgi:hypothetical protein